MAGVFIIRKGFQTTQREERNSGKTGQGKPFSGVCTRELGGTAAGGVAVQHI